MRTGYGNRSFFCGGCVGVSRYISLDLCELFRVVWYGVGLERVRYNLSLEELRDPWMTDRFGVSELSWMDEA